MFDWWKDKFGSDFWDDLLLCVVLVILFFSLVGCSASKKIADSAVKITTDATDIRTEVVQAKQNLKEGNLPAVDKGLDRIDGKATTIQKEAANVQLELTWVQDKIPYWLSVLKWVGAGIVVLGLIFVAWRLNLFLIGEKLIQGVVNIIAKVMGA